MASATAGTFSQKQGYRKCIGKKLTSAGKLSPVRFVLGRDEKAAKAKALRIEALWLSLDSPYWTAEALAKAEAIRTGKPATAKPKPSVATAPAPVQISGQTLKEAAVRYIGHVQADPQLSAETVGGLISTARALQRSPMAQQPISSIGYAELVALVNHWLSRPVSERTGKPISARRARNVIATARQLFDWLDVSGEWEAPRRFERAFRLRNAKNSGAPRVETFSSPELAALYRHANSLQRAMMLLALNCGFANMELATLRRDEVNITQGFIKRERQKTGVEGQWILWDETAEALRQQMSSHGSELAILDPRGNPLVYHVAHVRREYVRNTWRALLQRTAKRASQAPTLPFKHLRKTGATLIRSIGGVEVSELYLSHSEQGMSRFYSRPDYEHLHSALRLMRDRLAPMFIAAQGIRYTAA